MALYRIVPYYASTLRPETQTTLAVILLGQGVVAALREVAGRESLFARRARLALRGLGRIAGWTGRFVAGCSTEARVLMGEEERTSILFWCVKFFFLPLMLQFGAGLSEDLRRAWAVGDLYRGALSLLYLLDVGMAAFAYSFELRRPDSRVRSVDSTPLGWAVALTCYVPFNAVTASYLPIHPTEYFRLDDPLLDAVAKGVVLGLAVVFVAATWNLGPHFSNLCHRGVVDWGLYRWVRHPAYAAKVLGWWICGLATGDLIRWWPAYIGWTLVYALRAATEERHLCRDPAYIQYRERVRWLFLPGLI